MRWKAGNAMTVAVDPISDMRIVLDTSAAVNLVLAPIVDAQRIGKHLMEVDPGLVMPPVG